MVKRQRETSHDDVGLDSKRLRFYKSDRLSRLSDELLVKIFFFLPVSSLVQCDQLSKRLHSLSTDSQVWKQKYYNRFVRPRASRIPGLRDLADSDQTLHYASRSSRWLEAENLVANGQDTDWKKQYKLRHNWALGNCCVQEIQIVNAVPPPAVLAQLYGNTVFTADEEHGLRVWTMEGGDRRLLSHVQFKNDALPTSLAVNTTTKNDITHVTAGFADGGFEIFKYDEQCQVRKCYHHASSSNGAICAIAFSGRYLLTMTNARLLSLYRFFADGDKSSNNIIERDDDLTEPPQLIASLRSHTAWPPLALSLRVSQQRQEITASIAYALPTYLSGWSVGLQELRMSFGGEVLQSRLASAAGQAFMPTFSASKHLYTTADAEILDDADLDAQESKIPSTKPSSLSYSHPYLLASHPDNTLTLYLVHSSKDDLSIGNGTRLWGHTSSISVAHVGDRGKAVSVSAHGDEIRVWELEGGLQTAWSRKRAATGEASVQVRTDRKARPGQERLLPHILERLRATDTVEAATTKGWVGFNEEKVVVLQEKGGSTQALVVYDFS